MAETAARRALARRFRRIVGVDFDDPAELVRLVAEILGRVGFARVDGRVPARKDGVVGIGGLDGRPGEIPTIAIADAVAAARRRLCRRPGRVIAIVASEIAGPVLLAGGGGDPGRADVGAIVAGTPASGAVGWTDGGVGKAGFDGV